MPTNKNFQQRVTILDECFAREQGVYTLMRLREIIYERTGLEISRRTLQNDIRYIENRIRDQISRNGNEEESPVFKTGHFDGKQKAFRYARPGFALGRQLLSKSDQEQLSETLAILNRYRNREDFGWLDELIPRIESAFQVAHADYDSLISYQHNRDYVGQSWIGRLYNQLLRKKVLQIEYQSFKKESSIVRTIHPYHLKQYNDRWFLFGYQQDTHYVGMTSLALDRIVNFEETTEDVMPDTTNWGDYFDEMIGVSREKNPEPLTVKLRFVPSRIRYVLTKPLHGATQKLDKNDPEMRTLTIRVIPNRELYQQLLSFGADVEVLEPESVRNRLAEQVTMMNRYYI